MRSKLIATLTSVLAMSLPVHASTLWTTDFTGPNEVQRTLVNQNVDPLFTDSLSGTFANLTFSDTTFSGDPFKNVFNRTMFSPNTNVDNPAAAGGQNGGSWQSEFRFSGGTQTILLESVVFNVVRSNATGGLQATDALVRDITISAEYSLNGGGNWQPIDLEITLDLTQSTVTSPNISGFFSFVDPLQVNHETQDLWMRFTAANTGEAHGAYANINDITFTGTVIPEPSSVVTLFAALGVLLGGRTRRNRR